MSAKDRRFYPIDRVSGALPEFGIDANSLKTITFDLTDARNLQQYEIGGSVLWAIDSTNASATMQIRLNDQLRDPIPVSIGLFIKGVRFSRIFVSNTAQAGESITLLYCTEEFNNIAIENPSGAVATVNMSKSNTLQTAADVAVGAGATLVLAANANRRAAMIGNLAGNTHTMRAGDANVTATRGAEVAPGESFVVETTEAIYFCNGGGDKVSVVWTED